MKTANLLLAFILHLVFVFNLQNHFTNAILTTSRDDISKQTSIVNAFAGCNIHLMNFQGQNIDFEILKEPIILLRYTSICPDVLLYPFELHSKYLALRSHNLSSCHNAFTNKEKLLPQLTGIKYVTQTLTEAFELTSKNKNCEANLYLHPPTEKSYPQMYWKKWFWTSFLKNPFLVNYAINLEHQRWKFDYISTVPMISLLICSSTTHSICHNDTEVKKWMSSVYYNREMVRLSEMVIIWEFPSLHLKIHCPYCDPCDSFKTFITHTAIIPNSKIQLYNILKENGHRNVGPHSFRVQLIRNLRGNGAAYLKNRQSVLKTIQMISVDMNLGSLYFIADIHFMSLLLPTLNNVTFSENFDPYYGKWKNVIVDTCNPKRAINSHSKFRPIILNRYFRYRNLNQEGRFVTYISEFRFVSCHKETKHWTHQLTELIYPFDISTWILILGMCFVLSCLVKASNNTQHNLQPKLFDLIYYMFWSMLDQGNSIFGIASKPRNHVVYLCLFFVPLTWFYFSTIYKDENVTRLTADPPLTPFNTFEMLAEHNFTTYSRRIDMSSPYYHVSVMSLIRTIALHKKHGSVSNHEAFPVVSELWYEIMQQLRPDRNSPERSLMFLKGDISPQTWRYINNSAMLPNLGQNFGQDVSTLANIHMKRCNKSAIIVPKHEAVQLHGLLQTLGKPSYYGKDKKMETFWGYKFEGHFPPNIVQNVRFLFNAGVFEWWKKQIDYSIQLKTNNKYSILILCNQNNTSESGGIRTAVAVLSLIPGVGLLLSFILFVCFEIYVLHNKFSAFVIKGFNNVMNLGKHLERLRFKPNLKENVIIQVQPKISTIN